MEPEAPRVEGLREQRALPDEQHASRGVLGSRAGRPQDLHRLRIEAPDLERAILGVLPVGDEQEMPAVGQELRPRRE